MWLAIYVGLLCVGRAFGGPDDHAISAWPGQLAAVIEAAKQKIVKTVDILILTNVAYGYAK